MYAHGILSSCWYYIAWRVRRCRCGDEAIHQRFRATCRAALVEFDSDNNCLIVLVSTGMYTVQVGRGRCGVGLSYFLTGWLKTFLNWALVSLTICEVVWCIISVVSVCLSACQTINFESVNVGSSYLHIRYIPIEFIYEGHQIKVKVISQLCNWLRWLLITCWVYVKYLHIIV